MLVLLTDRERIFLVKNFISHSDSRIRKTLMYFYSISDTDVLWENLIQNKVCSLIYRIYYCPR